MTSLIPKVIPALALSLAVHGLCAASTDDWEVKMLRKLDKKVSVEFTDTKVCDALEMVASISGVNIVISPKVRAANTPINLKVTAMDAGTCIGWINRLAGIHAEVLDNAIYITDKPNEQRSETEKADILLLAARMGAEVELPAPGVALTDTDRTNIALKLWEKENVKPTDFPGPELDLGGGVGLGK